MLDGKYNLTQELGTGGMATVWAATNDIGHRFAIKVLNERLSDDFHAERRFLKEAALSNLVKHRSIVQVLDHGISAGGFAYMVMPLIDGETVAARVERHGGTLPLIDVVIIGCAILEALEAAHREHVVHCDIKPANVMVASDGEIYVLDFGIARVARSTSELTMSQGTFPTGTPAYMPPEQADGKKLELDGRTDIWATAAMMFKLITRRPVHHGPTTRQEFVEAASKSTAQSIAQVNADLPAAVASVIDKALRRNMADRWATAGEMRQALARAYKDALGCGVPTNFRHEPDFLEKSVTCSTPLDAVVPPVAATTPLKPKMRPVAIGATVLAIATVAVVAAAAVRSSGSFSFAQSSTEAGVPSDVAAQIENGIQLWMRGSLDLAREQFAAATGPGHRQPNASLLYWAASDILDQRVRAHAAAVRNAVLTGFESKLADALKPLLAREPRYAEVSTALATLHTRFPHERVATLAYATQLLRAGDYDSALTLAATLGPEMGNVRYWLAAQAHKALGHVDEARPLLRQCLEAAPDATNCLEARARMELDEGQCIEGENAALDYATAYPDQPAAVSLLANAKASMGDLDEARVVMREWSARTKNAYPEQLASNEFALGVLEGNFAAASHAADKWAHAVGSSNDALSHGAMMLAKFELDLEQQDINAAAADAKAMDLVSDVWPSRDGFDLDLEASRAGYRIGRIPRSQFVAERDEAAARTLASGQLGAKPFESWLRIYPLAVQSKTDAIAALAGEPSQPSLTAEEPRVAATLGHLYLLADRADDAIPYLRRATRTCAPMAFPFDYVRSFLWLGEALAKKGQRAEACGAFAVVRKRWGHVPSSRTVAEARRQEAINHCTGDDMRVSSLAPSLCR